MGSVLIHMHTIQQLNEEIVFRGRKSGGTKFIAFSLEMMGQTTTKNHPIKMMGIVKLTDLCNGSFYDAIFNDNNYICLKFYF